MKRQVALCLCLWSLIGSAVGEIVNVYVAEGQTLTLRPKLKGPVQSVEWKRNHDIVAESAGNEVTSYDNRIALNVSNAVLELVGVVAADAGTFTVCLNNMMQDDVFAVQVIEFVPEPEVHPTPLACSKNLETCTLHCDGDTSGAEPVTYFWRKETGSESEPLMPYQIRYRAIDRTTYMVMSFSCIMQNPLGWKESQAFANPFYQDQPVIEFGPEPEVYLTPRACSENLETCTLHCGGNTNGREPVTYFWRTEPGKEMPGVRNRTIDRTTSAVKSFFCIMQNPFGRKESRAFANPFYQDRPVGGLGPSWIARLVLVTLGMLCGVAVTAWFSSRHQRGLDLRASNGAVGGSNLEASRPLSSNNRPAKLPGDTLPLPPVVKSKLSRLGDV